MKTLLLLAIAASSLAGCSSRAQDRPEPGPASVRIDSSGVVVDTTSR
jgi:nitrous oxide reductase accessory protein NosL